MTVGINEGCHLKGPIVELVNLGQVGIDYVNRRLAAVGADSAGLNRRLSSAVSTAACTCSIDGPELLKKSDLRWSDESVSSGLDCIRHGVRAWLDNAPVGLTRYVVFEDVMMRSFDPIAAESGAHFFGVVPIYIGPSSFEPDEEIEDGLTYGGQRELGFLCEVPADARFNRVLTESDIDQLASGAKAVVAWAWDDLGIVIGTIGDQEEIVEAIKDCCRGVPD